MFCAWQRRRNASEAEPHLPELTLALSTKGKGRWPFGWEVLRGLKYPDDYPFPPKSPPAGPCGWGGARY